MPIKMRGMVVGSKPGLQYDSATGYQSTLLWLQLSQ